MDDVFGAGGALAEALPGYEPRPEQAELAQAVADALEAGEHLLAEAGTGTGKSLAYLVPALVLRPPRGRGDGDESAPGAAAHEGRAYRRCGDRP